MIENLENTLKKAKKIVFLTGGWISQESGISTFRGKDGLWQKYDPMKLASAQPCGRRLISIAEADLAAGPSKRILKNEKKKVIVYTGIVVVVL